MSVNRVFLLGNLGKDAESRQITDDRAVVTFTLATSEVRRSSTGETREDTTWHNVCYWTKPGAKIVEFLRKGTLVFIEGSINNRQYEDQSGNKRFVTEIRASNIQLVGPKPQQQQPQSLFGQHDQPKPAVMPTGGYAQPRYDQPQNAPQGFQQTGVFPTRPVFQPQEPVTMPAGFEDLPDGF